MKKAFLFILLNSLYLSNFSQGLERVFLETIYIADQEDEMATNAQGLKAGMTTYRLWVDMSEGYRLLSVYGAPGHPLSISSTEPFFNDTINGKIEAPDIDPLRLGNNVLLLDSYIAISGASRSDLAVLKEDDTDGSVARATVNNKNPVLVERGVLMNQNPKAGIPVRDADGIMDGSVPALVTFGDDFVAFGNSLDQNELLINNGAWAVFKGLPGPFKESNYVMIAQLTTAGKVSYELNLQLSSPQGVTEYYVAKNPTEEQFTHPDLKKSSTNKTP